jgi:hypothetical protein
VVVLALAAALPAGLALQANRTADRSTARAGPAAASSTTAPNPEGEAALVTLVHRRCPQVRRLRLADLDAYDFFEPVPCAPRGRGTVRFARIAQVLGTGVEVTGWVEVDAAGAARPHS